MRIDEIKKKHPGQIVRLVQTKRGWEIRREVWARQRYGKGLTKTKSLLRLLAVYPA